MCRMRSIFAGEDRMLHASRRGCGDVASIDGEQIGRGPMKVTNDMTSSSRIGRSADWSPGRTADGNSCKDESGFVRQDRQGSVVAH